MGAENSESCLSQFSSKREVRGAVSINNLILVFLSFSSQISRFDFQNYESFRFSMFCLLLANPSRVNLGFGKNVGV